MSDMLVLATAIQNLADAIIATGAVMGSTEVPSSPRSEVSNDPQAEGRTTRKPKAAPSAETTKPKDTGASQEDAGSASSATEVVDLIPDIKKLGLEVAKDNREGVVELLKEFDVPEEKLGNVPAAQQADFLARLQTLKEEGDLA